MIYAINILNFFLCIMFIKKLLHVFQLKDYNFSRYINYFNNFRLIFVVFSLILLLIFVNLKNLWILLTINLILIFVEFIFFKTLIVSKKTPLKATNKIKRLYIICSIILAFLSIPKFGVALTCLVLIFLPPMANLLNIYDKIKNKSFIKSAKQKLKQQQTKIIAITGSNGKTSVKNILQSLLETTYKTQSTPKSFNTPLGISKFINEQLTKDCEFLILEYGARRIGDVKKLCKLFGADYGIITTIAPQHLQTFTSIQNVFKAKKELSDFLQNKPCIYNLDNLYTLMMFQKKEKYKTGISIYSNSCIFASDIRIKNFKTHFKISINKKSYNCHTNLLGKHNITNILLAFALALELQIKQEKLIEAISNLKPTPHRLEYVKGSINILDDSYNCSLESAKQALGVLFKCQNKKMVVTPGIIEGGKQEFALNYNLGKMCVGVDYAVFVGEHNKKALVEGLKSKKSNTQIFIAKTLEEAKQHFSVLSKTDTLLLLNDLPDDYR